MTAPRTGFAVLDRRRAPVAFAHRGGAYHPDIEGLENTRAAFAHAYALGFRFLETDVHVTRDGHLLAFHDTVLDRVTDRSGAVADLTLAEVRAARVGGREEVPLLADLLADLPDAAFNVDLKADGAVEPLAGLAATPGVADRLVVTSFSPARLRRFRRLTGGRVATSAALPEIVAYRFLPSGRLARAVVRLGGGRPVALQVPHRRELPLPGGRSATITVVTRGLVRRAHAAGLHVHVWTIDDPTEMRELLDRGVDGLMTDRTDLLRDVLRERGQWEEA